MSKRTELEDQISALIQKSNKENEDKLKVFEKAFEGILKANYGISVKELEKLIEADKRRKEKAENRKNSDADNHLNSDHMAEEKKDFTHPNFKPNQTFVS